MNRLAQLMPSSGTEGAAWALSFTAITMILIAMLLWAMLRK